MTGRARVPYLSRRTRLAIAVGVPAFAAAYGVLAFVLPGWRQMLLDGLSESALDVAAAVLAAITAVVATSARLNGHLSRQNERIRSAVQKLGRTA